MNAQPTLTTPRLTLRPFSLEDAAAVQMLAGAREIADTTMHIPHPYPPGGAEQWIATHPVMWKSGTGATYAITDSTNGVVMGAVTLTITPAHARGELGYWLGVPFWNKGYCTEASRVLLDLGFGQLALHRIQARHLTRNPASGRVLEKLGMQMEGIQRDGIRKNDRFEDMAIYAILETEWPGRAGRADPHV